jgi:hypothetical protein
VESIAFLDEASRIASLQSHRTAATNYEFFFSIPQRIIVADYFHSLFVWSGIATLDTKYDVIRQQLQQFLLERAEGRFPMPNLHLLTQNDSMSRRFTALLAPAHGDPVEHQLAHNTALAQLSVQEQTKLNDRFRFYNPDSDPSFRKWFWEVASAASASREEGVSLCD